VAIGRVDVSEVEKADSSRLRLKDHNTRTTPRPFPRGDLDCPIRGASGYNQLHGLVYGEGDVCGVSLGCFGDSFRNVVQDFDRFAASSGNHVMKRIGYGSLTSGEVSQPKTHHLVHRVTVFAQNEYKKYFDLSFMPKAPARRTHPTLQPQIHRIHMGTQDPKKQNL